MYYGIVRRVDGRVSLYTHLKCVLMYVLCVWAISYVGEFRGDTGTAAFEKELFLQWICVDRVALPNFGNTNYTLTCWDRKVCDGSGTDGIGKDVWWPFQCVACGYRHRQTSTNIPQDRDKNHNRTGPKKACFRDRYTRSICVCSRSCADAQIAGESLLEAMMSRSLISPHTTLPQCSARDEPMSLPFPLSLPFDKIWRAVAI